MSYTVKITYKGVEAEVSKIVAPICRIYHPEGAYIDTPVYTQGGPVTSNGQPVEKIGEVDPNYGKSVYATNVTDFGTISAVEPFASTGVPFPVPMAQFKLAMVSTEKDSEGHPFVKFEVDDYKEGFFYMQIGAAMADQGFVVEVNEKPASA